MGRGRRRLIRKCKNNVGRRGKKGGMNRGAGEKETALRKVRVGKEE